MRLAVPVLVLVIFASSLLAPARVGAQASDLHNVALYAHEINQNHVLNASTTWGGITSLNVSRTLTFALQPELGDELQINGAITMTAYIRSSAAMQANLEFTMSERTQSGDEIPVSGANIESPIVVGARTQGYTIGIGTITYLFQKGSSILVNVRVEPITSGTPYLIYDDRTVPTRVTIPAISPSHAALKVKSQGPQFGRIIEALNPSDRVPVDVVADVRDAFGMYRFTEPLMQLTSPESTTITLHPMGLNESEYSAEYTYNASLRIGTWQMNFKLVDLSGDSSSYVDNAWVAVFYPVRFDVVDNSNVGVDNASVSAWFRQEAQWYANTNRSGWVTMFLPSTTELGSLNATVSWKGVMLQPSAIPVGNSTTIRFILPLTNMILHLHMSRLPLPGAEVTLSSSGNEIGRGLTGPDGSISFGRLPEGNYSINVRYLLTQYNSSVSLGASEGITVDVPVPQDTGLLLGSLGAAIAVSTAVVLSLRRRTLYPHDFSEYYDKITMGGLPEACFVIVAGNSGSGKSVLLETLAERHLIVGNCIFVANSEHPAKVRESMKMLGIPAEGERTVIFLDAYSALAGTPSVEQYSVPSVTDLTGLGLTLSKCMEVAGEHTDVFLDSLNPLLAALRVDYLLNFLQSTAARVKASGGRFYVSVGLGIDKSDMTKLEEASDCVIETQVQDTKNGQRRRMRIKKLRGQPYDDKWTQFKVDSKKGIVYLSRTRPEYT